MRQYLVKRLLLAIPTLLLVSISIFVILRILPGDVLVVILGKGEATIPIDPASRARLLAELHLDRPIYLQYLSWMGDVFRGDLGTSFWRGDSVTGLIMRRGPVSAEIGVLSFIVAWIIGLPVGIIGATRRDTLPDYVSRVASIVLIATPNFWIAAMMVTGLVMWFQWLPSIVYVSFWDNPVRNLQQVFFPALILATGQAAMIARMSRSTLLEVMREDYIRTAHAKGLGGSVIMWRHAIRNAVIPVITLSAVSLGFVLGGSVAVERAFNVPGLGMALLDAVNERDYVVIQNLVLLYATLFVVLNLIVDVSYALVDPRIRYK